MAEEMPAADPRDMYSSVIGWLAEISSQTAFFNLKESKKLEHVLLHSWLPWRQQQHVKGKKEKEEEKIVRSTRWLNILQPN